MRLFIGNGLHQAIDFQYRLPKYKSYRMQTIQIGGQIQISGDLTTEEIDRIVLQHAIYGMVGVKEFRDYKMLRVPYIYSVNEPISQLTIEELVKQNREFSMQEGKILRQQAALAVADIIENNTPQIPGIPKRELTQLEMEIEEIPGKDKDATMNEGVRVTKKSEFGAPQGPAVVERANISRPHRSLF